MGSLPVSSASLYLFCLCWSWNIHTGLRKAIYFFFVCKYWLFLTLTVFLEMCICLWMCKDSVEWNIVGVCNGYLWYIFKDVFSHQWLSEKIVTLIVIIGDWAPLKGSSNIKTVSLQRAAVRCLVQTWNVDGCIVLHECLYLVKTLMMMLIRAKSTFTWKCCLLRCFLKT